MGKLVDRNDDGASHKKSPARQAPAKQRLMASTAQCGPFDPVPPRTEAGMKVTPHQQYEALARGHQKTTDSFPPELQPSSRKSAARAPPDDAAPDRSHDRLIRKAEVQLLIGSCSHMHLKRLVTNPASGFPQPVYQGRIPHWWRADVVRWINRLAAQPRVPPPQVRNFAKGRKRRAAHHE